MSYIKILIKYNIMELENICRCCLSLGTHKDLDATHVWLNQKEIYSEMLNECFSIILSSSHTTAKICDDCIKLLRDSAGFKQQVLRAEQEFLKRCKEFGDDAKVQVKIEPKKENDDDSDDYFLADTVSHDVTISKVKQETKDTAKRKTEPKRRKKTAVKSLETSEYPELTITSAPRARRQRRRDEGAGPKRLKAGTGAEGAESNEEWAGLVGARVKRDASGAMGLVEGAESDAAGAGLVGARVGRDTLGAGLPVKGAVSWVPRATHAKVKHKENLQTILSCSNVTPFKNKNLLGFTCGYCNETYPDPADLRSHTHITHSSTRLQLHCSFELAEYIVNLDITDLTCTLCDTRIDHLSALKDHLVKTHGKTIHTDIKDHLLQFKLKKGDVYDCAMCTSTYETFKMLKQHMNKHYSNYSCSKCESSFATKRSLSAHAATHLEGSFKCGQCDKVFSSKPKKQYHEKTIHMGARNISNCPFCDEPFRSYYRKNQHLVKVHNAEARYKCNVCNKAYILKSLLMCHIKKNHLMEKNCQCTECGYRFFSKKALKAHMVKHSPVRAYACSICHKTYARKYTLREHTRIHDNDRRFRCALCSHAFVQKCSLRSHLLSTHGLRVPAGDIAEAPPTEGASVELRL